MPIPFAELDDDGLPQLNHRMLDVLPVGIVRWVRRDSESDNLLDYANPAWLALVGLDASAIGKRHKTTDLIHADDREAYVRETGTSHTGTEQITFQLRYQRADGSVRWVRNHATGFRVGDTTYRTACLVDVTAEVLALQERERALALMRQREAELSAFAYSVSHDLLTPLRAIDGFSLQLLKLHAAQVDEQGRHLLERTRAAAQRMGRSIDAMMELARIGDARMTVSTVDLSALATSVAQILQEASPQSTVQVDVEPGMQAMGDARLLQILMDNLIGNAFKFSSKVARPKVEIGSRRHEGRVRFFVRDNGVGFDPAYADKLFVPFHRLHSSDEFPGSGIGLASVERVIRRHGGRIWAESSPGQGATFWFTLDDELKT